MEENKKATIEKIYQLTKQDVEFNEELRKKLGIISSANSSVIDDERLSQIYEYCIEKIIRKQAEEFYNGFPITSIIPTLVDDYVRMEFFRRKDNFGDFCLALYQQIENITNKVCESSTLGEIVEKMWGHLAYVKTPEGQQEPDIKDRTGKTDIANLIFFGTSKSGLPNAVERSKKSLQNQYASDKIRIIVYYYGFGSKLKSSEFDNFREITSILNDIYQCRNMNHRGNTLTSWEEETLNRIIPMKSFCYFKYLGCLAQFVSYIKKGEAYLPDILSYARSLGPKKVELPGLNIKGKMDIAELEKMTKKRK
jgi:hypothetical protein